MTRQQDGAGQEGRVDECDWCGEPPERPCISWMGRQMVRRHAEIFGRTPNHAAGRVRAQGEAGS